jgi:hypothetical protein
MSKNKDETEKKDEGEKKWTWSKKCGQVLNLYKITL